MIVKILNYLEFLWSDIYFLPKQEVQHYRILLKRGNQLISWKVAYLSDKKVIYPEHNMLSDVALL